MRQTSLPLILEPAELEHHLHDSNLLIVDLCNPQLYAQVHVPGAVNIAPQHLVAGTPPATGKLPAVEQLENLFSLLGYTGNEHIVVYDDEGGGWAGRFIWTLDIIGHKNYSYLNGGIHAWLKEDYRTESKPGQVEPNPCFPVNRPICYRFQRLHPDASGKCQYSDLGCPLPC